MRIGNVHRKPVMRCKSIVSRFWAPTIVGVSATVLTSYMFVLDLDGIIARLRPASSGVAA
jgi:hypothetical protein